MKPAIAIYYATMTGSTEEAAFHIASLLGKYVSCCCNIDDKGLEGWEKADVLMFGTCTWDIGKLPSGWKVLDTIANHPLLVQKKIALFGLGDQGSYPDSFSDALGILYRFFRKSGCTIIGRWPADGYEFYFSKALDRNFFYGLVLDENQQPELSEMRTRRWVEQIRNELQIPAEKLP